MLISSVYIYSWWGLTTWIISYICNSNILSYVCCIITIDTNCLHTTMNKPFSQQEGHQIRICIYNCFYIMDSRIRKIDNCYTFTLSYLLSVIIFLLQDIWISLVYNIKMKFRKIVVLLSVPKFFDRCWSHRRSNIWQGYSNIWQGYTFRTA